MPPFSQPDPKNEETYKYTNIGFYGAGQDSYTRPFVDHFNSPYVAPLNLFQALTNVMPVSRGTFALRYGYSLFNNPNIGAIKRIYSYQNVTTAVRKLLYVSGTSVSVSAEDGSGLTSVITSNASNPRAAISRDYAFIPGATTTTTWPSAQQSDGKKWHNIQGLSDWGLAQPPTAVNVTSTASAGNITLVSTAGRIYAGAFRNSLTGHYSDLNIGVGSFATGNAGPNSPGTVAQTSTGVSAWTNINNVKLNDGSFSAAPLSTAASVGTEVDTEQLLITNFGFSIPSTATIYGITVSVVRQIAAAYLVTDKVVQLLKASTNIGDNKADLITGWPPNTGFVSASYGGATDLWGTTWTPTDVNSANFGVALSAQLAANAHVQTIFPQVDYVSVNIVYATGAGANSGTITSKQVALSLPTASAPAGADKFTILATLDGGDISTFYVLDTVPIATSTYTDNTPDNVLATNNIAVETDEFGIDHGLINNEFPPLGLQFPTKHRGRIYGMIGEKLYFSKSLDEITTSTGLVLGRHEEAWPATNNIDVSTVQETPHGLLSDGNTLYIGTDRHIWKLDGDGPSNFSKPEIIFNEVGIADQECWDVVFAEGQPVGMIWLTPDLRIMKSNFASYQDIGTPIQDVLSTVNTAVLSSIWASFFSQSAFDVFILALPTGVNTVPDTLCVFDLRASRWMIWRTTDALSCGLFNINASGIPQWLIGANSGKVYQFLSTATQDRVGDTPQAITATVQTIWLPLDRPTFIKVLNELEVLTTDSALKVTIEGASTATEAITSPITIVSNASLATSPNGLYKVYLAGKTSAKRYYRFTFTSTSGISEVLGGFLVEAIAFSY